MKYRVFLLISTLQRWAHMDLNHEPSGYIFASLRYKASVRRYDKYTHLLCTHMDLNHEPSGYIFASLRYFSHSFGNKSCDFYFTLSIQK